MCCVLLLVTKSHIFEPAAFARFGAPMMARSMRKANRKDLERLKRLLESR